MVFNLKQQWGLAAYDSIQQFTRWMRWRISRKLLSESYELLGSIQLRFSLNSAISRPWISRWRCLKLPHFTVNIYKDIMGPTLCVICLASRMSYDRINIPIMFVLQSFLASSMLAVDTMLFHSRGQAKVPVCAASVVPAHRDWVDEWTSTNRCDWQQTGIGGVRILEIPIRCVVCVELQNCEEQQATDVADVNRVTWSGWAGRQAAGAWLRTTRKQRDVIVVQLRVLSMCDVTLRPRLLQRLTRGAFCTLNIALLKYLTGITCKQIYQLAIP